MGVGRFILAWTILALLLFSFALGLSAYDTAIVTGQLTATDQEADEGYFALGMEAAIVAKPGSELHRWLTSHAGQRLKLSLEPDLESDSLP